jgi:ABC-type branched-subunit amino acid transport system substrate-binding protein
MIVKHRRLAMAIVAVLALTVTACTSRADQEAGTADDTAGATTTVPVSGDLATSPDFGSLEAPCGPGDGSASVDPDQNAGATDVIRVATATDKGFEISPGLNQEMEDAAKAFVAWCNAQGGVQGLPLELILLDGGVFNAVAVIEEACDTAFAMVGGGLVFDAQAFPRFHECDMIDIAGFTVSVEKAMSNGMAQPLPNPSNLQPSGWMEWTAANYPEEIERTAVLWGNAPAIETNAAQVLATMEEVGGFTVVDEIVYNTIGESNWAPFAQRLRDNQVTAMTFVGQPSNLVSLLRSMDEIGYRPPVIFQQTNFYDEVLTEGAGPLADGVFVRTSYAPFEEPEVFPAMAKFLAVMDEYNPGGKIAGLSVAAMSAYLLFVTSANECLDSNDGVLERECVLGAAKSITSWDGGGLHSPGNPADNEPASCELMMVIEDGKFVRVYPEVGSDDDNGDGWHCYDNPGTASLDGEFGDAEAGVDPTRPN